MKPHAQKFAKIVSFEQISLFSVKIDKLYWNNLVLKYYWKN